MYWMMIVLERYQVSMTGLIDCVDLVFGRDFFVLPSSSSLLLNNKCYWPNYYSWMNCIAGC